MEMVESNSMRVRGYPRLENLLIDSNTECPSSRIDFIIDELETDSSGSLCAIDEDNS